nr:MAG TPA: hypothetical protein [Caudoviricetes sp.]
MMKLSFLSNRAACCGVYLMKTADFINKRG